MQFGSTDKFRSVVVKIVESGRVLAKPLWVGDGPVKLVASLIKFELASLRSLSRFCQKSCNLGSAQRLKIAGGAEGLLKD